jgi:Fe-S-cluster containining protein
MTHESSDAFAHEVERRAYSQRLDVFLSSRDAGLNFTADAITDGVSLQHLITAAGDVSGFADEAIAIVTEEYRPPLDCQAGCSFCCRKPGVLVTLPEFLRILQHVRETFDAADLARVRENAAHYVQQLGGRSFDAPTPESFPCPLLTGDGRCNVYEIRPHTCRGYNSTSVEACRQAHESTDVLVPVFALIKDVSDGATVGAATALRQAGSTASLVDLGTALDIAFERGERFAESVAAGGDELEGAQNRTWVDDLWAQVRETARSIGVDV